MILRWSWPLSGLVILVTMLPGCSVISPRLGQSGYVWIDEPVMARGVDEQGKPVQVTSAFNKTEQRIYCSVTVQGPEHVRLGARWYYGDKLIYDRVIDVGPQHRGGWWLEMAPGKEFPTGDYRVEIYLIQKPDRVVRFQIVD